jgi:hypothetical protein
VSPSLSASSQKALAALWRLADSSGRVQVRYRSELLAASRLPRGTWDRAVKGLEFAGLVQVERAASKESRPSCYVLTGGSDRARSSQVASQVEPRPDVVLSSLIPKTKDKQQEPEPSQVRSQASQVESGPALALLAQIADSWERMALAQERLAQAAEDQAQRAKSRGAQSTESPGEAPSCRCGPMVVRSKGGQGVEQFFGCAEYPRGCGAPTIPLRSSMAVQTQTPGFRGRNVTAERTAPAKDDSTLSLSEAMARVHSRRGSA